MASADRVQEVVNLLDLMEKRGITSLKVGDIELTRSAAPIVAPLNEESSSIRPLTDAEKARQYKRVSLAATSRITERSGE